MNIADILNANLRTVGKIWEPPTPSYPAGRYVVVQRVTYENANFVLPDGQPVSVYPWFIPNNPRTPRQQANRMRLKLASNYLRDVGIPTTPRIKQIMRDRQLPEWHAKMRYLLKESGLF